MMERLESENINEIRQYLRSGDQTKINEIISELAGNIDGNTREKISKIFEILKNLKRQGFDEKIFRKRTAAQILKDGFVTGCTDAALVYIALARLKGMPSKYIETIDKEWLIDGGKKYLGHIYAQSYDNENKKWIWVDPMKGDICDPPSDRVIYKEGLDSWDIGINDFESLKKVFNNFRDYWIKVENRE